MMTAGILEKDMEVGGGSFLRVIMFAALFSLSSVVCSFVGFQLSRSTPQKT
jgi:hypothetical protein